MTSPISAAVIMPRALPTAFSSPPAVIHLIPPIIKKIKASTKAIKRMNLMAFLTTWTMLFIPTISFGTKLPPAGEAARTLLGRASKNPMPAVDKANFLAFFNIFK